MRRPALVGVAAFALVLAAFVAFAAIPFVTKKRDTPAAITSPPALERLSLVGIAPHHNACIPNLAIDKYAGQARFRAGTFGKPGPALRVTFSGGITSTSRIAPGWPDNSTLRVPVPAARGDALVKVCIYDDGRVPIGLYSAADRARSRALAITNGNEETSSPQFGFWEAKPVSIATRAPATVDRISVFRGPVGKPAIVWFVLVLFLLGLPLGAAWLVWRAD